MKGGRCRCTVRLSAISLGVALGILSAISLMLLAWVAYYWGTGSAIVTLWSELYPGYEATPKGIFFGGAWGFLDGFLFGVLLGWIYNLCSCCCSCCSKSSSVCCKSSDKCEHVDRTCDITIDKKIDHI